MLQPEHQVGAFLVNYFNSWRKNHGNHSKHGKELREMTGAGMMDCKKL